ncbi:MAG: flagellar brake protein [Rubrivivax sp.]|nr:flagellar brake protein [Rubrivivax sp.]
MFQDTRPAELDTMGGPDPWADFRVTHPQERLRLLRELRDGNVPVILNTPGGSALSTTVWAVDEAQRRLNFSAEMGLPQLERLVEADEAVAVAYLESVKLQFELQDFVLVRGAQACTLQCRLPGEIYRFQRRSAYRVRTGGPQGSVVRLRHPAIPDMPLALRMLDVSIGGCALWLPDKVPALQAGTRLGEVHVELDIETRFSTSLAVQHVSSQGRSTTNAGGVRLGCEWKPLNHGAERVLQRWIDRAQQRRRLLALG